MVDVLVKDEVVTDCLGEDGPDDLAYYVLGVPEMEVQEHLVME